MKNIITNVALADGTQTDIAFEKGKITQIGKVTPIGGETVTDGGGKTLLAGFIDMHCHLREPGFEYKEDMKSGLAAAVKGGFTGVCPMPNTKPVVDNKVVVKYLADRAKEVDLAKVYPIGAISKGQCGEELAEIISMKNEGIVAVSDDGRPVMNANLMRLCLEYIRPTGLVAISHCEDKDLAANGSVNEGYHATLSGIRAITRAAEEVMVARDIILAETFASKLHIAHVSTKGSVQLVREAKARGVNVTCETCPHYFAGDDSMILSYDTNAKVNPPLRERADVEAIIEGLADGTIDVIATDHAPHHVDDKNVEFDVAAFGISGFETAFALCYTHLVKSGKMTLSALQERMSARPAGILGLKTGIIEVGMPADFVLCDLNAPYVIDSSTFVSKGKNTPFNGREVFGKVLTTYVDGKIKYSEDK